MNNQCFINGDIVLYHNQANNGASECAVYYEGRENPMSNLIVFDEINGFKYGYCDKGDLVGRVLYSDKLTGSEVALLCVHDYLRRGLSIQGLLYGYCDKTEYIRKGIKIQSKRYMLT